MKKNSIETEIEQIEKTVEICRFNYDNQKKKMTELNHKIASVKMMIENTSSATSKELENLTKLQTKLNYLAQRQKSLILEFRKELVNAIKRLKELKDQYNKNNS